MNEINNEYTSLNNNGIRDGTDMIFDNNNSQDDNKNTNKDIEQDKCEDVNLSKLNVYENTDLSDFEVYENTEWKEEKVNAVLRQIPCDWEVKKLKDKLKGKTGLTPETKISDNFIGNIKWINISDMKGKMISNKKNISENVPNINNRLLEKNSLLFSFKLSIGKVGFTKYDNMMTNEAIVAYEPSKNKFLNYYYYILPKYLVQNRGYNAYGARLMNSKLINNADLVLSNDAEKEKIRSLLTKQEDIIENINKRIELSDKKIKYYQQELLSGRLRLRNSLSSENEDNREVKTEEGDYKIVLYENTEWKSEKVNAVLRKIPYDWNIEKLGKKSTIQSGKANARDNEENGIFPLYDRSENIKKSNTYIFDNEAIIYPGEGQNFIGKYYKGKYNLHQRAYCIFDLNIDINIHYLKNSLKKFKKDFLRLSVGSTVPSLRKPIFDNFDILIPETKEQTLIRDFLTNLDNQKETLLKLKEKEEKTFKYLQQEFLSGRKRLR